MPIDNTGPGGPGPDGTGPGGTGPGGVGPGGTGPGGVGVDNATLITIPKPPKPEIAITYDGSIPDTIGAGRDVTVSESACVSVRVLVPNTCLNINSKLLMNRCDLHLSGMFACKSCGGVDAAGKVCLTH